MFRIGNGYDVHRLKSGRKLIIGGVDIPHSMGLVGHSDADVLLHAICDALLGACGAGDIGQHFPDTDSQWNGISSILLLRKVGAICDQKGFKISNVDSIVVAQKPKLSPYMSSMKSNISMALEISDERVNVKATTTEKLGFEGSGEGISAHAIALLGKR